MTVAPAATMCSLVERLYDLPRSITGDGVRTTFDVIEEFIPLARHEVPSGTAVLDWTVPPEWNVRQAWIKDPEGRMVVDYADLNLHLVGYSVPVHRTMALAELQKHLHSLPDRPDLVPWRTSYYTAEWGFCLADRLRRELPDGDYEVYIDATLEPDHLTYAECVLPGASDEEVLISAHTCHPSLANDNLSGIAVAVFAALALQQRRERRYTYRFLFAPGTIGAITWLAQHREDLGRIRHGLTLSCLGDGSPFTYKCTFDGDAEIDRVVAYAIGQRDGGHETIPYFPYGYDERQYNSPGFRLPVGALVRARHGAFPEYHTSGDNLDFVRAEHLQESLDLLLEIIGLIEDNRRYRSLSPYGEPQLGRRGLFKSIGGLQDREPIEIAMLWVLASADGDHDLLSIAERSGLGFPAIRQASDLLRDHSLIAEADTQERPGPEPGGESELVPRVSVGLPVYNGENYLKSALESLLAQDFEDFELIISDNASTDGTEAICREFAQRDPRIRYERQPVNRGAAWNFNHVFHLARADYFRWACHDDLCEPTHLRRCVETLDAAPPSVVLAYSRTMLMDEHDQVLEPNEDGLETIGLSPHQRVARLAQELYHAHALFGLMRRDALARTRLLGGFQSADTVLMCELAVLGEFIQIPEYLFYKRMHPERLLAMSRSPREMAQWFDTSSRQWMYFPTIRMLREHASLAWRYPLPLFERARTTLEVRHWVRRRWRLVVKEMLSPVVPSFRVYR